MLICQSIPTSMAPSIAPSLEAVEAQRATLGSGPKREVASRAGSKLSPRVPRVRVLGEFRQLKVQNYGSMGKRPGFVRILL